tara:strand:+ start:2537 stop:2842 length:306 start_codon:yes stop_codon:yes gene_type:complete
MVTISPDARANCFDGIQREARTIQLKKQYAPLIPDRNLNILAISRLDDTAKSAVKIIQDAMAVSTSFLTENLSRDAPTKNTNAVVAYKYIAEKFPSSEAFI